jgi:Ca2+-binding EF-hand superfamily protein
MGAPKTKKQSFVALDVLAALSVVLGLLFMFVPSWNEGPSGKVESPEVHEIVANAILLILTGLVIVSLTFETIEEYLEHTLPEVFMPVLDALNTELMGMGFLAIIFYFVMKFKLLHAIGKATVCKACDPCLNFEGLAAFPTLNAAACTDHYYPGEGDQLGACIMYNTTASNLAPQCANAPAMAANATGRHLASSDEIQFNGFLHDAEGRRLGGSYTGECYEKHCDELLIHMFEDIHMTLFLVLLSFFIRALLLLSQVVGMEDEWTVFEDDINDPKIGEQGVKDDYYKVCANPSSTMKAKRSSQHRMEFMLLRKRFLDAAEGDQGGGDLDNDFDFDEYLAHNASHLATEVVEIPPIEWLFLECFFVMVWAAMQAPPYLRIRCYFAYCCCMFAFVIQINGKLDWVLSQIMISYPKAGSNGTKAIVPDAGEGADTAVSPPFMTSPWAKARLGNLLAAKAHSHGGGGHGGHGGHDEGGHTHPDCAQICLFWRNSPGLIIHCIRFCMIVSLVGFVIMVFVLPFCWVKGSEAMLIPALLPLPALGCVVWYAPSEFIRKLTMCTSVEQLKNPKLIKRTLRNVRLKKTLRALKALRAMKNKVAANKQKLGIDDGADEDDDDAETQRANELRRLELQEMFNLFDLDKGGDVQRDELGPLMQALGITLEKNEMDQMFDQFDQDKSGAITFDEFWKYMKQRDTDPDPEELCKEIFDMIDEDKSGTVTNAEFKKMMDDLNSGLTQADIDALIKEIDKSGDGQIDYLELADVLLRYKD